MQFWFGLVWFGFYKDDTNRLWAEIKEYKKCNTATWGPDCRYIEIFYQNTCLSSKN